MGNNYYESQRRRRSRQPKKRYNITGEGLFDSFKKIAKDTAKDLVRKGLNEAGKKGTNMLVNKIIPPKKGKGLSPRSGLTDESKKILSKHTGVIPIEKFVNM